MVIQHNIMANFTSQQLGITNKNKQNSAEKLGSGYKINRAADDAANLSISEKMRSQIRGLEKASYNIQEGVSLAQTAEGGLAEIHSILHRTRELAVQASNDTYTDEDRKTIQKEVDQLLDEIDRISEDTEFNTIKVLKGKETIETEIGFTDVDGSAIGGLPKWVGRTEDGFLSSTYSNYYAMETVNINGSSSTQSFKDEGSKVFGKVSYKVIDGGTKVEESNNGIIKTYTITDFKNSGNKYAANLNNDGDFVTINTSKAEVNHSGTTVDFSKLNASNIKQLINEKNPQGFYSTCCTCTNKYSINFVDNKGSGSAMEVSYPHYIYNIDISSLLSKSDVKGEDLTKLVVDELEKISGNKRAVTDDGKLDYGVQMKRHYSSIMADGANLIIYDTRPKDSWNSEVDKAVGHVHNVSGTAWADTRRGLFGVGVYYTKETALKHSVKKEGLNIQAGANTQQKIEMPWPNVSTNRLGVETVPMLIGEGATRAIEVIDEAIVRVGEHRSEFGVVQNRLEHAQKNADNTAENLQTAESRIRDTDIPQEMLNFSKNNILIQASESILAQVMNFSENILSLLA